MTTGINQYKVGDSFEGFLLLKNVTKGTTSTGKPFLTLILADKTGEIEAKLWDSTKEDEETFLPESVVNVSGRITEFRGMKQLTMNNIRPQQPTDGVNVGDFVKTAPVPKEELIESINKAIFEITNPNIQRIVRSLVEKHREALLLHPAAAMNHH